MMMKFFEKYREHYIWIAGAAILCIDGLFFLFVWLPFTSGIFDNKKVLDSTVLELSNMNERQTHFLDVQKNLSEDPTILRRIEDTLLDIKNPLPFIELVETLAREQGVSVEMSVLSNAENPDGNIAEDMMQGFQVSSEGAFPAVFQYLKILEKLPYQVSFDNIFFDFIDKGSSTKGGKSSIKMIANLIVKVK